MLRTQDEADEVIEANETKEDNETKEGNETKEASKKGSTRPQKTKDSFPDDPMKRHEGLKLDIKCEDEERKLADLRRKALEHARKMPKSEEN